MLNSSYPIFNYYNKPKRLISLTPLIDVVFILLLFFMSASNYQKWHSLPLETVQSGQGQAKPQVILVRLKADSLDINGTPVNIEDLNQFIKEKLNVLPNLHILVQPVGKIVVQRMVNLIDQVSAAGCQSISIVDS